MSLWLQMLAVLALIALNGFLAMAELSMVSARPARLKQLARRGNRGAAAALDLLKDPTGFLSSVQVGITLIGVLAGAFSGATLGTALAGLLRSWGVPAGTADTAAIGLVVLAITYLSLILGELVPKRLAMAEPERLACRVARPMQVTARLATPAVWLLRLSTVAVLRLLGAQAAGRSGVTGEEIRALLAEGAEAGVVQQAEHEMIQAIMRIADRPVRSIMTPRVDLVWLDARLSREAVRAALASAGHSRYPVTRHGLEEVVGVLHVRRLAAAPPAGPFDLATLVEPPLMVPEGTPVLRLIEQFRRTGRHFAIVVDEYGVVEGVATPADVLAAIAGDLPEGPDAADLAEVTRREDGSWLADGRLEVHRAEQLLDLEPATLEGPYATLAGFILWQLGHMPRVGEAFTSHGHRFEVVDLDGRRIDKVLIAPAARADAASTGAGAWRT
ncbi:MAG: hemolysin family protein [Geminicoccaceae bacterium]